MSTVILSLIGMGFSIFGLELLKGFNVFPFIKSDGVGVGVMAIFGWELSIGFNVSTFIKSVGASVGVSLSDLKACTAGGPLVGMSA